MRGTWNYLRKFDAYSKPIDDIRIKTFSGACITLVSAFIICFLVFLEIYSYMSLSVDQELFVDANKNQKIKIQFDIKFPSIACEYLSLDAMDVSGEQQTDVNHDVDKTRISLTGVPIAETLKQPLVPKQKNTTEATETDCGSCYGAETPALKCCNTCAEVREAYHRRGWALAHPDSIKQCREEGWKPEVHDPSSEGCHMHGFLLVNKVAGNFHFAPGHSFPGAHMHVHDLSSMGKHEFNSSHYIHSLTFGESIPMQSNPLNDVEVISQESSVMYSYYVKVVPTTYTYLNGTTVETNQYSVTKHEKKTSPTLGGGRDGLPGLFIVYDMNPMLVKVTERRNSLTRFLTNVCAIVGGVFTVSSLVDSLVYFVMRFWIKQMQTGKAT